MNKEELNELISQISHSSESEGIKEYEAYAILDKMHYTKEELAKSIDVLWDIVMVASERQRKTDYLFEEGLIVAKESFLDAKKDESGFTDEERIAFQKAEVAFQRKLVNIKPAVEFLIRMKEVV
jgi:hypothetical protein